MGETEAESSAHPASDRSTHFERETYRLGELAAAIRKTASSLDDSQFGQHLWSGKARLWSYDAPAGDAGDVRGADVQGDRERAAIRNRLGWLDIAGSMLQQCAPLLRFVEERPRAGDQARPSDDPPELSDGPEPPERAPVARTVLLGMGGSSLGAEVAQRVFGIVGFQVLDSTVPGAVASLVRELEPGRTSFIVSSKSGGTVETRSFADTFHEWATVSEPGRRFVAVTDPGTELEVLAKERGYERIWLNPPDIGGRYSVLSYFGLVPMAFMGIDVREVLERALQMAQRSAPEVSAAVNPGIFLGIVLAECHRRGRDKVTFVTSDRLAPFGDWAEQLIAESTGKQNRGLIPLAREPLGAVDAYGTDRVFVHMRLAGETESGNLDGAARRQQLLDELEAAGHPVVELLLEDPYDLGQEFLRWELAVATAGALMRLNPFDEPNVREAKERTAELLAAFANTGELPGPDPVWCADGISLFARSEADPELAERAATAANLTDWLQAHLGRAAPPDYVALQAFLAPCSETEEALQRLRAMVRDALGTATTTGWGPRYLHSTGQLHKGGPPTGLFLQITAADSEDVPIPGRPYTFGVLARAQALGDFMALCDRRRRVLRVDLGSDVSGGLERLLAACEAALSATTRPAAQR